MLAGRIDYMHDTVLVSDIDAAVGCIEYMHDAAAVLGSVMAAVARSALIKSLVVIPKVKAAAFFQPEVPFCPALGAAVEFSAVAGSRVQNS